MIGAITVPAMAAQSICDRLVAAGVTSILNFAPIVLSVPAGVDVRKVDLSIELQILAFHAQRRSAMRPPCDLQEPPASAASNGSRKGLGKFGPPDADAGSTAAEVVGS